MSARSNHGPKTQMLEPIPIPVSRFPEVNKTTRPAASRACPRRKPKAVRGTDLQLVLFAAGRNRPKSEKARAVMTTDNNNVIPFRPRKALACALPEGADDDYALDDETLEDAAPVASRPHSIDVIDGAGGNSLLDACLPRPIAMAAVAFIMEQLAALPATA
jgi:hypothetical protein